MANKKALVALLIGIFSIGLALSAAVCMHVFDMFVLRNPVKVLATPISIEIRKIEASGKNSRPKWVPFFQVHYEWGNRTYTYAGGADSSLFPSNYFRSETEAQTLVASHLSQGRVIGYINGKAPDRFYVSLPSFNKGAAVSLFIGLALCSFTTWALLQLRRQP
jgi:hypothetical protein